MYPIAYKYAFSSSHLLEQKAIHDYNFEIFYKNLQRQNLFMFVSNLLSSNRAPNRHHYSATTLACDSVYEREMFLKIISLYCDLDKPSTLVQHIIYSIESINKSNSIKRKNIFGYRKEDVEFKKEKTINLNNQNDEEKKIEKSEESMQNSTNTKLISEKNSNQKTKEKDEEENKKYQHLFSSIGMHRHLINVIQTFIQKNRVSYLDTNSAILFFRILETCSEKLIIKCKLGK